MPTPSNTTLIVKYNGATISPAPLVQQSQQFIDYGNRWGHVTDIELNGNITGITTPLAAQSGFAAKFTGQFGRLEVLEGTDTIYRWDNIIVDEISSPQNHLFLNSFAPYTVKMRSINVPSGVLDPVNEYNFSQQEDGTVSVTHKVSARGIHTQNGGLANAIAFVKVFTGHTPFIASCASFFIPSGSGILVSVTENIDRASCLYSVHKLYKYNTGAITPYVENWTVSTSDIMDNEWLSMDVDWRVQGSPVDKNLSTVETSLASANIINKVAALGYSTGNLIQSNLSYNRDSGAALIQMRTSFISGYNLEDVSGYFDYTISLVHEGTIPKEDWRIEGDFVCFGPKDYRVARLDAFKTVHGNDWRGYLTGLIISSPLYTYHDSTKTLGMASDLDIRENTGLAQLHLSLSTVDGGHTTSLWYPKYTLNIQPNKWNYNMIPSANIEGHYVLQDLQMMSQGKIQLTVEASSQSVVAALISASGFLNTLSSMYVSTGYVIAESYNTGTFDLSMSQEWMGLDPTSSGLLYTKVAGSTLTNYQRPPGYQFGY